jgi:hypothetical protein
VGWTGGVILLYAVANFCEEDLLLTVIKLTAYSVPQEKEAE